MTYTTLHMLKDARELLTDPARWTQGALARSSNGYSVPAISDQAVCWCTYGAIKKVVLDHTDGDKSASNHPILLSTPFDMYVENTTGVRGFVIYNDTHTHEEVLALFDAAIAHFAQEENEHGAA